VIATVLITLKMGEHFYSKEVVIYANNDQDLLKKIMEKAHEMENTMQGEWKFYSSVLRSVKYERR
jgi:hypothetical protein